MTGARWLFFLSLRQVAPAFSIVVPKPMWGERVSWVGLAKGPCDVLYVKYEPRPTRSHDWAVPFTVPVTRGTL